MRCSLAVRAAPITSRSRACRDGSSSSTMAWASGVMSMRSLRRSSGWGRRRTRPRFSRLSSSEVIEPVVTRRRSAITHGSSGWPAPSTTARTCRALGESWYSSQRVAVVQLHEQLRGPPEVGEALGGERAGAGVLVFEVVADPDRAVRDGAGRPSRPCARGGQWARCQFGDAPGQLGPVVADRLVRRAASLRRTLRAASPSARCGSCSRGRRRPAAGTSTPPAPGSGPAGTVLAMTPTAWPWSGTETRSLMRRYRCVSSLSRWTSRKYLNASVARAVSNGSRTDTALLKASNAASRPGGPSRRPRRPTARPLRGRGRWPAPRRGRATPAPR